MLITFSCKYFFFLYTEENSWSQLDVSGSPPCARHGHVSVAVGTDIFIHGGMAGTNMYDDLYKFNTGKLNKKFWIFHFDSNVPDSFL